MISIVVETDFKQVENGKPVSLGPYEPSAHRLLWEMQFNKHLRLMYESMTEEDYPLKPWIRTGSPEDGEPTKLPTPEEAVKILQRRWERDEIVPRVG